MAIADTKLVNPVKLTNTVELETALSKGGTYTISTVLLAMGQRAMVTVSYLIMVTGPILQSLLTT